MQFGVEIMSFADVTYKSRNMMTVTVVYFIHFECVGQGAVIKQIPTGHVIVFFLLFNRCAAVLNNLL